MKNLLLLSLICLPALLRAEWARVTIDGLDAEWTGLPVLATDGVGDAFPDLTSLQAVRDEWTLVLKLSFDEELLLQQDNSLRLVLDTDANPATGLSTQGLGAELVWTFGSRSGTVYSAGGSGSTVFHDDIGLRQLPSHSSSFFEIALDLAATPTGSPLFPWDTVRAVVYTNGGDRLPDSGSVSLDLGAGSLPELPTACLPRPAEGVRLLSWNVLSGSLFNSGLTSVYQRILRAAEPDLIVFCEVWDQSAAQVATRLETLLPESGSWQAVKEDAGNVIASRFPIRNAWEVQSGYRETAALIDASAALGDSLLLVACHLRCCSADAQRQDEADGLVAFLKDAREPGGRLHLPEDTPMLLAGDFNLVGERQQLVTLLTGDIVDNGSYGPDSPPDWDGSPLADAIPRHATRADAFTWFNEFSSYPPGRLDYILYTASVLEALGAGVLWTPALDDSLLSAWQLQEGDTPAASDHLPLWFDFRLPQPAPPEAPQVQISRLPNGLLQLNWNAVENASSYRVEYRSDPFALWVQWSLQSETSLLLPPPAENSSGMYRVITLE